MLVGEVVVVDMKMINLIVTHEKIQAVDGIPEMDEEWMEMALQERR